VSPFYGFSPAPGSFDMFGAAARAQVNQAVSKRRSACGASPTWWRRVKTLRDLGQVTMKKRPTSAKTAYDEDPVADGSGFFISSVARWGAQNPVTMAAQGNDGPGFRLLHLVRWICRDQQPCRRRRDKVESRPMPERPTRKVIEGPADRLALIKVEAARIFPFAKLLKQGQNRDWVHCGRQSLWLAHGHRSIVFGQRRDIGSGPYDDFIQIDAPVNKGNSGWSGFQHAGRSRRVTPDLLAIRWQRRIAFASRPRR